MSKSNLTVAYEPADAPYEWNCQNSTNTRKPAILFVLIDFHLIYSNLIFQIFPYFSQPANLLIIQTEETYQQNDDDASKYKQN